MTRIESEHGFGPKLQRTVSFSKGYGISHPNTGVIRKTPNKHHCALLGHMRRLGAGTELQYVSQQRSRELWYSA